MKVSITEPVAAGAVAALRESTHPDVRHLVKAMDSVLKSRTTNDIVSGDEWAAVLDAIDYELVKFDTALKAAPLLRSARPKIEKLLKRQLAREDGGE